MKLRHLSARLILASSLALSTLNPTVLRAQGASDQAAYGQANQLFDANQYENAAKAYEALLKDYPTSPLVPLIQFRLGQAAYLTGAYEQSLASLRKIMEPSSPASDDVRELAAGLIPQTLAAQAAQEKDDAKKKAGYEAAIKEFGNFLTKYPKSDQIEYALYGRALANLQIEKYSEAAADLRENLARFPRSETILDTQYLLALVLVTEGSLALQKDPASAEGATKYEEARKLLEEIVAKRTDIALINDAQFQIGELLFRQGTFASGEQQKALWESARKAYRAVQPKEPMIQAQQARLKAVIARKIAAGRAQNVAQYKQLEALQEKQATKLEAVKAKGDLTLASQIKIAQIFFYLKGYDEARVILHHVQPFAEDAEQKRDIAYFLALSYASQNLRDQAVAAYDAFQSAFKGDPIAENLPLAIGTLFLTVEPHDPEKAISYFKEGTQLYPEGRFLIEMLTQQASALVQLQRFDEALKAFQDILATKPRPEIAAPAEFGIGTIYKDKTPSEPDKAIAAFEKVRETYKGTQEAENSSFWIARLLQMQGKTAEAVTAYTAFLKDNPKSALFPTAKFFLGETELARNDLAKAEEIFREVATDYPEDQVAPYTYFQRAGIFGRSNKVAEMVAVMREFITKYPENENIFVAYDSIGKSQLQAGKPLEAAETYQEMVTKYPKNPRTANALQALSQIWFNYANSQGRYLALNEEQRAEWNKGTSKTIEVSEKLITDFPESPQVVMALEDLLETQKLLLGARLKTPEQITEYFQTLASRFEAQPSTRSKILFTLASYTYETDKAKALEQMQAAYDPSLVYSPNDLDLYGMALADAGQIDKSTEVYTKLAGDYPVPAGVPENKAPAIIQEAQSISLYGQGHALQAQGQAEEAKAFFDKLKALYPWSPKLLEANYGIAQALFGQKKYDEAGKLLIGIIRAQTATAELRANAAFLNGEILEARGDLASAIDQFIKISAFYSGVDTVAAEGLWRGSQLLEKQATTLPLKSDKPGAPTKGRQLANALKYYRQLVEKYPNSPRIAEAQARIKALTPTK